MTSEQACRKGFAKEEEDEEDGKPEKKQQRWQQRHDNNHGNGAVCKSMTGDDEFEAELIKGQRRCL